jgi:arsenate reductase
MAEGILREALGDSHRVASAGSQPTGFVHPLAIKVMAEHGIDISGHASKSLEEFLGEEVETVVTVCGAADLACPAFPGRANRHHFPFDDPALAKGTEPEQLAVFRKTRDAIRNVFHAYAAGRKDGRRSSW